MKQAKANEAAGLQRWVVARLGAWQQLLPSLQRLERERTHSAQEALEVIDNYRLLGRDLSIARRVLPASRLTRALDQRYARLHAVIHRKPQHWPSRLHSLFRDEIPAVMYELRFTLAWVTTLTVLSMMAGWWLVATYPELAQLFASEEMINGVEQGKLWTRDPLFRIFPPGLVSTGILTNNIVVALKAACLGILFGLGTFYVVISTGLMVGTVFSLTTQHNLGDDLFEFVIAHGVVELSVICVASAVGVMLGESLMRPTHATRLESFQHAAGKAARVLLLCSLLLLGSGFIEGEISLLSDLSLPGRIAIGFGYGGFMIAAFSGRLFGRRPAPANPVAPLSSKPS